MSPQSPSGVPLLPLRSPPYIPLNPENPEKYTSLGQEQAWRKGHHPDLTLADAGVKDGDVVEFTGRGFSKGWFLSSILRPPIFVSMYITKQRLGHVKEECIFERPPFAGDFEAL